jgi:hypothetical protein
MNNIDPRYAERIMNRQGLKLAAQLNLGAAELPYDISERLRAARERAVAQRKIEIVRHAPIWVAQGGTAALGWGGEEGMGLFSRLSGILAIGVLVLGLLGISDLQSDERARELADVDMALLTDELPPQAFADPGFIQFLQKDE